MTDEIFYPSIAIVGKQGSGKSTIAKALITEYGYTKHSWADPVRQIFEMAYGEITDYAKMKVTLFEVEMADGTTKLRTGREMLQLIGTEALRNQVDQQFWIKAGLRRIWRGDKTVNDDTRFLNEARALRSHGWLIVRIEADEETRIERLGGGETARAAAGHSSETEQDAITVDLTVRNDGLLTPTEVVQWILMQVHASPDFTRTALMVRD